MSKYSNFRLFFVDLRYAQLYVSLVNYYCLQKSVDEHGKYISAHQQGLKARNQLTMRGLVVLVVVIVAIIAAFTAALCWKAHNIEEIEDMLSDTRDQCADQVAEIKEDVQASKRDILALQQQNLQQEHRSLKQKIQDHAQKIENLEKCVRDWRCKYYTNRGGREFQDVIGRPGQRVQDSETLEYDDDDD